MLQIKNTLGGGKPEGMYAWTKNEIGSELKEINKSISRLPYEFYQGSAVMLNGEIHILGGANSTTNHYKWNGSSWASVSTLPYNFVDGCAVVLNNEIHIFGSGYSSSYYKYHYKWDGTSWTSVSTLPYNFSNGCAVVLDNEIHILGSNASSTYKEHYKWNGSSWTSVSTLPYNFYNGSAVVLDGEIHIFSSTSNSNFKSHYKWNGSSWASVSTLPYSCYYGSAVVFEGKIHIMGGDGFYTGHYRFDGTSWVSVNTLPYSLQLGSAVVCEDGIHILGSNISDERRKHYLIIGRVPVYTFLDYIVSDKETAYPDGGEKGRYWYEKVSEGITPEMFGCTKMEASTFTLASRTSVGSYTITHSLGVKPRAIVVLAIDELTVNDDIETFVGVTRLGHAQSGQVHFYHSTGNGYSDSNSQKGFNSIDENTVVLSVSYEYFGAGIKYGVLVMA